MNLHLFLIFVKYLNHALLRTVYTWQTVTHKLAYKLIAFCVIYFFIYREVVFISVVILDTLPSTIKV